MSETKSSYRQILKATSMFGGVQVFNIIINIVRSKLMAILLGPAGIGINSLFTSTIQLIEKMTSFGLKTSAVKNVSQAHSTNDNDNVGLIITVVRRWVWITGLLGTLVMLVLSPWLSQIVFKSESYTMAFVWISVSLLFNQITSGQLVILQGMRKINYLARASMSGSLFSLILTVPLYYLWGIDGIVPAIIATSITRVAISWHYAKKQKFKEVKVPFNTAIKEGREMLLMGFMVTLSSLIASGSSYILRIYISNSGGVEQVGLYAAGFAIINTYVGLVFSAMATDYYPRLSTVSHDNKKAAQIINHQAEIAILILAPILNIFLVFIDWIVVLLYSDQFIHISGMIHFASLGMYFKASSWAISYIFLAKSASILFLGNELFAGLYMLGLNILGYQYAGLTGLGLSFLIGYLLYFVQVYLVTRHKYAFCSDPEFIRIFGYQGVLAITCFLTTMHSHDLISNSLGSIVIVSSFLYSIFELNKRLDLRELFARK